MKLAVSAVLCVLLSPLHAMLNASRLTTRAGTRNVVRRVSTAPMQHARPRPVAPKESSMAGFMVGLAVLSAGLYSWDLKDDIMEPTHNVHLDSYMEEYEKVAKILDYLEAIEVIPYNDESLAAWKKECESIILHSDLPLMLKWSLWSQASNFNVWYKGELRSFFYSAIVKSYVKLEPHSRARIVLSGTEQFVEHLYGLCAADFHSDIASRQSTSGLDQQSFSALFKQVYDISLTRSAQQGRPSIDEFCGAIVGYPAYTTEASRESLYNLFQDLERFRDGTFEIQRATGKPFDIAEHF